MHVRPILHHPSGTKQAKRKTDGDNGCSQLCILNGSKLKTEFNTKAKTVCVWWCCWFRPLEGIVESCWNSPAHIVLIAIYYCRAASQVGSLLIFIIPVIKTKENAVSFESALSGVHQVQTPLPESLKASVLQPISQNQNVWGGLCCCDWSPAFLESTNYWQSSLSSAMSAGWTPLFALSVSQNVGHNAYALKQDLIEWNEISKTSSACFTLSVLSAWIMVMT